MPCGTVAEHPGDEELQMPPPRTCGPTRIHLLYQGAFFFRNCAAAKSFLVSGCFLDARLTLSGALEFAAGRDSFITQDRYLLDLCAVIAAL